MNRSPQVYNIDKQGYWKHCHNPIYEILKKDFDEIFLQKTLSEQDVDGEFYVDTRLNENSSNSMIIHHWNPEPETITSVDIFKSKLQKNGLIYFLLGRKGIGKSSLLVHFLEELKANPNVLPIYLDMMHHKSNSKFLLDLHSNIYKVIFNHIIVKELNYYKSLQDLNLVRELDPRFAKLSDERISELLISDQKLIIGAYFHYLNKKGISTYLIIDNIDDWPIKSIPTIIDVCHSFKDEYNIKSIIALRDYWTPRNLDLTDYNYASLLLTKPDFYKIISRRLDLIKPTQGANNFKLYLHDNKFFSVTKEELIGIYHKLAKQIHDSTELQNTLFNLSNCNTREYIKYIFYFFHSIYLSSKPCFEHFLSIKICEHIPDFEIIPNRNLKFHDFIENNMAIHSLCYDTQNSLIFNLFYHKYKYPYGEEYKASLIFLRILQNISAFAPTEKSFIISNLSKIGYPKGATQNALKELLAKDFIESPEGAAISKISNIFLSIKGETYLKTVLYEYNYYLYLADIIPMPEDYRISVKDKYGEEDIPIARGSLVKKNESVRNLIKFLKKEQEDESEQVIPERLSILDRYREKDFFDKIEIKIEETITKLLHGHPNRKKVSDSIIQKITIK